MSQCASPIPYETLVRWWTDDLSDSESASVEEHFFGCDFCAEACDRIARLVVGLKTLIPPILSHAARDRLVAGGMRVLHTPVEPDVKARARFAPGLDLLVHALHGDLARAERVDLELLNEAGVSLLTFEHVPFDRERGEVLIACQRHYESLFPGDLSFRVLAVEAGERRRVGDYFVAHEWK